jgi:hypothetical protein
MLTSYQNTKCAELTSGLEAGWQAESARPWPRTNAVHPHLLQQARNAGVRIPIRH